MLEIVVKEMIRAVVDSGMAWFLGAGASAVACILIFIDKITGG